MRRPVSNGQAQGKCAPGPQLQHWAEDRSGEVIAVHVVCLVTLVAAATLRFYAQSFGTNLWKHADNWLVLAAAVGRMG
ncbi:Polyketide synthase-nonribosomal peptide synthetase [Alternaria alternata]|nr:Polyketide synthase-nonribosomal peptide synthetase [Alternaria alternata]